MRTVINASMKWVEKNLWLWLQLVMLTRLALGEQFDSGPLVQRTGGIKTPCSLAGQPVQPQLLCWEFGTQYYCNKKPCKFRHESSVCSNPHSFMQCSRGQPTKDASGNAGGGKEPQGRGFNSPR